jgi:hypothetical protein
VFIFKYASWYSFGAFAGEYDATHDEITVAAVNSMVVYRKLVVMASFVPAKPTSATVLFTFFVHFHTW